MPPAPHRRVTLGEVARAAGVSAATGSRSLAGDPRISGPTRERVRRAAERLGYVPNAAARSLRRQATRTLGLLLVDLADPVHGLIAAGFEEAAAARGFTVIFVAGFNDPARERRALQLFAEHRTDGVALVSSILDPAEALTLIRSDRVVLAQADHPSLAGYGNDRPVGSIRSDDAAGAGATVRHLLDAGYREIGYVGAGPTASNATRRDAVLRALRDSAARPRRAFAAGRDGWRDGLAVARRIARDLPEALICYDDKLALALMDGLRACGLDVPRDVGIAGYDDIPFAACSNPRLTTVASPSAEIGRLAVRMLVGAIEGGELPPSVVLPVELVVRESTPGPGSIDYTQPRGGEVSPRRVTSLEPVGVAPGGGR